MGKKTTWCEDCGETIPLEKRRTRCKRCKRLICSWCYHHAHAIPLPDLISQGLETSFKRVSRAKTRIEALLLARREDSDKEVVARALEIVAEELIEKTYDEEDILKLACELRR